MKSRQAVGVKWAVVLGALALALPSVEGEARADERPPISGSLPPPKPPHPPATKAPSAPQQANTSPRPFDGAELGPIDKAAKKSIDAVVRQCTASPHAREGMNPAQEAKCNAVVATLLARGKKGASAIVAALNEPNTGSYFSRNRLYFALSKIDDEKLRVVTIRAMGVVNASESSEHRRDSWYFDRTLREMMGGGPDPEIPWEPAKVRSDAARGREEALAWSAFQKKVEGKTRDQIKKETLDHARSAKADDDPKKAFRAMSTLLQRSPKEALIAAKAYLKRSDLTQLQRSAFEQIESEAGYTVSAPPRSPARAL